MTNAFDESEYSFIAALKADRDLDQYGNSALLVFALGLYLRVEDPSAFAADALTEQSNDKKVDLCHIDENEQVANRCSERKARIELAISIPEWLGY